jgi:hemerythrin HHE cation binding domain-containing protein
MTDEMATAHRALRRESAAISGYVRRLRAHFAAEDEVVGPRLLARLDLDADAVLRMELQHKALAAGLAELEAAWDALVDALDRHRRDLLAHFDEEERHVLPLIEEHLPVGERD